MLTDRVAKPEHCVCLTLLTSLCQQLPERYGRQNHRSNAATSYTRYAGATSMPSAKALAYRPFLIPCTLVHVIPTTTLLTLAGRKSTNCSQPSAQSGCANTQWMSRRKSMLLNKYNSPKARQRKFFCTKATYQLLPSYFMDALANIDVSTSRLMLLFKFISRVQTHKYILTSQLRS